MLVVLGELWLTINKWEGGCLRNVELSLLDRLWSPKPKGTVSLEVSIETNLAGLVNFVSSLKWLRFEYSNTVCS